MKNKPITGTYDYNTGEPIREPRSGFQPEPQIPGEVPDLILTPNRYQQGLTRATGERVHRLLNELLDEIELACIQNDAGCLHTIVETYKPRMETLLESVVVELTR